MRRPILRHPLLRHFGHAGPSAAMRSEPALAVLRLVTCSRRELASSMAMMAFLLLLAGFHQAPRWMPLAATLLAAWLAAAACLALLHLVFPPDARWWWAWLALLPALAIGAGAGWLAYGTLPFASFGMTRPVLGDAPLLGTGLAFCALTFGVPLLQAQRQAQALQLANLKHAALQAQLKSLQAQVEPHFLFNTLSNTRYLARHAPEQAVTMLDHLIAYLRAALPDLRSAASTVGRECELARHYLALMAIRFGARLTTEVACPPQLAPLPLPPPADVAGGKRRAAWRGTEGGQRDDPGELSCGGRSPASAGGRQWRGPGWHGGRYRYRPAQSARTDRRAVRCRRGL
jgi:hypothetical protein